MGTFRNESAHFFITWVTSPSKEKNKKYDMLHLYLFQFKRILGKFPFLIIQHFLKGGI